MIPGTKTTRFFHTVPAALLLAAALSFASIARETGGEGGGGEAQAAPESAGAPIVIEEEPYEYYYWPDDDLDNFGLSSMGGTTGEGTTMGETPRRKSNIEANTVKPGPTPAPEDEEDIPPDEPAAAGAVGAPQTGRQTGASGAAFYKWVDDKGGLHITNNIGEVPLEYQQQIYRLEAPGEE